MTTEISIDAAKRAMRTDMDRVRNALSTARCEAGADTLRRTGLAFAAPSSRAVISGYAAIGTELNLWPLLETLAASGHPIALPVTVGKGAPLIFRAWKPETPLKTGAFSVPVPDKNAPELEPEILLVPLLAFDKEGFRLGYGAGFYDRTLAGLRQTGPVVAVGVAFHAQQVDRVPETPEDGQLDWIVTDQAVLGPLQQ